MPAPISAHRAFLYAAAFPGWGEWYAGARSRSIASGALFLLFTGYFTAACFRLVSQLTQFAAQYLQGNPEIAMPPLPFAAIAGSLLGMYFIWLWAMISAVDAAGKTRIQLGESLQRHPAWAVGISWLCPGAGQVYCSMENRKSGYLLFGAYLMGFLLMIPVYIKLGLDLAELLKNGGQYAAAPLAVVPLVKQITGSLTYSFAKAFQAAIRCLAIAGVCSELSAGARNGEAALRFFSFLLLGWLCPGSGQILQRRSQFGWILLALVLVSNILIGIVFDAGLLDIDSVENLSRIPGLITIFAMFEAAVKDVRSIRETPP